MFDGYHYGSISETHAYQLGLKGGILYGGSQSERAAYESGLRRGGHQGIFPQLFQILILFFFFLIARPLVLYSPFLVPAFYTFYFPEKWTSNTSEPIMSMSATSRLEDLFSIEVLIFVILLLLVAYFYYCLFQYIRGIMVAAKEKKINWWRIIFIIYTLIVTIIPFTTAFKLTLLIFPGWDITGWIFALPALYWAYNHYDLLNKNAPSIVEWAFNMGYDRFSNRLPAKASVETAQWSLSKQKNGIRLFLFVSFVVKTAGILFIFRNYSHIFTSEYILFLLVLIAAVWMYLSREIVRHFADILYDYRPEIHLWKKYQVRMNLIIVISTVLIGLAAVLLMLYLNDSRKLGWISPSNIFGYLCISMGCGYLAGSLYGVRRIEQRQSG